jgi:hypothetical protein
MDTFTCSYIQYGPASKEIKAEGVLHILVEMAIIDRSPI